MNAVTPNLTVTVRITVSLLLANGIKSDATVTS